MKYRVILTVQEKRDKQYELLDEQAIDISEFTFKRLLTFFNAIKGKRSLARLTNSILK